MQWSLYELEFAKTDLVMDILILENQSCYNVRFSQVK